MAEVDCVDREDPFVAGLLWRRDPFLGYTPRRRNGDTLRRTWVRRLLLLSVHISRHRLVFGFAKCTRSGPSRSASLPLDLSGELTPLR